MFDRNVRVNDALCPSGYRPFLDSRLNYCKLGQEMGLPRWWHITAQLAHRSDCTNVLSSKAATITCKLTLATFSGVLSENLTVILVVKKFNAHLEPKFPRLF